MRLRPVIHIMSDVVTIAAFLELGHNASCMWRPVAVLAVGYHFVSFLMAECACQDIVLSLVGSKEV